MLSFTVEWEHTLGMRSKRAPNNQNLLIAWTIHSLKLRYANLQWIFYLLSAIVTLWCPLESFENRLSHAMIQLSSLFLVSLLSSRNFD